jgi:hypothetical protein
MNMGKLSLTAAVLILILIPPAGRADILYLKNGRQLKVERAWQDTDQIWFILQGLKASIPQSRVVRIESGNAGPEKLRAPANQGDADEKRIAARPAENLLPNQLNQSAGSQTGLLPKQKGLVLGKDGFDDLKWGIQLWAVKGLEKRSTDSGLDDVAEYTRPADVLKLGDAALTTVVYAFWRDQLYTITLWAQGPANYAALRTAVFEQFGAGTRVEGAGEKYLWSNDQTDAMLKYDNENQYGMLWMRSSQVDRKIKLAKISSPTSYLKWMKTRK